MIMEVSEIVVCVWEKEERIEIVFNLPEPNYPDEKISMVVLTKRNCAVPWCVSAGFKDFRVVDMRKDPKAKPFRIKPG